MATIPIVPVSSDSKRAAAAAAAANYQAATQFFRNYTKRQARVPMAVWWLARGLALAVALGLAVVLLVNPALGLQLFWGLAIPVVPALLVIAPGLWRQVCPMATLNQLPRLGGFTRARELPLGLKQAAFSISVALFLAAVSARVPLLNHSGAVVGGGILLVLALAFAGGAVFKGRSGWCGTFCPLAPIQRTYGQAPLVVVRNGFCEPCVGCQKSCYDFNPRAAVFSDIYDEDPRHAAQRRLFMGLLPGLILGYFLQGPAPAYGTGLYLLVLLGACCASAGAYGLAVAFAPASPYRVALVFGAAALSAFYWFAGPLVVRTVSALLGLQAAPLLLQAAQGVGLVLAAALVASGLHAERRYRATLRKPAAPTPEPATEGGKASFGDGLSLKARLASSGSAEVTDRQSGITFQVAPDASLLEAIQGAGLKISFGCRAGVCGADPVAICDGAEHLSPPGDDELATLRRLGLEGRARLACMCTVRGPVLIDRDPHSAPAPQVVNIVRAPVVDKALHAGIQRVVVIGNGVAGMGVAEALRRQSPSLQIDVVGNEPFAFYNRMGIGRLVYDSAGLEGLLLVPPDWPEKHRIGVHRGMVAARIDRDARQVVLANGQAMPYDKLVLATGARSTPPDGSFMQHVNAFMLRTAEDAQAIRHYVGKARARRAVVVGGGVLGVEAADALHHLGLKVTLLQRADRLMNAQLDTEGGAMLRGYLESIGSQVATGMSVEGYEGTDTLLQAARLAHGPRVKGDVFVAALGIQANTFLAQQAGLALGDNGVRVDTRMRTADPHIYAVGDVAELKGTPRGLWPIGSAHAATAAAAILGDDIPYATPRIVLQLKCEGIDLRSQGDIVPREGDEDFHAREGDPAWWRLVVRHGQLAGGLYVGPPGTAKAFTKLLQNPVNLAPLREQLRAGQLDGLKALGSA
jgi:NADPH-dependent 2,4-dienoyl-CoA reductase/sulfur reductase-like enzyme/ferredoxin